MHSPDPVAAPLDHLLLRGRPGDIALKAGKVIFSYAALEDQVARLAAALHAMGVGPGDRLACWLPKTALACMMPLAAARAGAVYVPINPLLKAGQVAHILEDSGAAALITDAAHRALMPASTPLSACPVIYDRDLLAAAQRRCGLPPSIRDPQQLCQLLYTSGSTGLPKGVMLSHANIWLGAASVAHYLGLDRDDRTLAALPLSFDYGQSQLLSTWYAGGRVVPMSMLTPELRTQLFTPEFQRHIHGYRAEDRYIAAMAAAPSRHPLDQAQYADLKIWLPGDILTKVDRTSMSVGLEVREPMLDPALIGFATGLAVSHRIRRGQGKALMKQAMAGHLPDDLLYRPKMGFVSPISEAFRGPLIPLVDRLITRSILIETGWFDRGFLDQIVQAHRRGRADHGRLLWQLIQFDAAFSRLFHPDSGPQ